MSVSHPYILYSASAGAGKTSTLTVQYLCLILKDERPLAFREILGLTFTNKAVGEMKKRILEALSDFAKATTEKDYLFDLVLEAINQESDLEHKIDDATLRARARKHLKELLHNYSYFDISTIDKFNHRLIKTFAKDLKLPSGFKVILDTDEFLNEGLDALFDTLSEDEKLKEALVSFALEKIDNNNSWDVSYDLFNTSMLLFDETHFKALEQLSTKSDEDFKALKEQTRERLVDIEKKIITVATTTLELLEELQLIDSFTRSYLPKFLVKIKEGERPNKLEAKWLVNFDEVDPYNKTLDEDKKAAIDQLKADLSRVLEQIKKLLNAYYYTLNAYKNILPLSLIFKVQQQLRILMEAQQSLPIAEFNKRIFEVVRKQAVPFIYERLGERYKHFFIDEFQDTSVLQWKNLIPLVSNALSVEQGSAMLVGDPKQAIYRWRGGEASQFIELYENTDQPFSVKGEHIPLEKNYRSTETVVNFNNDFFECSADELENQELKRLFKETSRQEIHNKEQGWLKIEFVEGKTIGERSERYCEKTFETIEAIIQRGFSYVDICVLTRSNKQSLALAEYLTEREIPIVSSESLLLSSSMEVSFLIDLLYTSSWPMESYYQARILEFLYIEDPQQSRKIQLGLTNFDSHLDQNFGFSMDYFNSQDVFDGLSYAIERFGLALDSSSYINYFLDQVYEYFQTEHLGVSGFLERWEEHRNKWSIKSSEAVNAVQLMTIHKSKGLEFEFVIFPFAEQELIKIRKTDVLWVAVDSNEFAGFDQLLFSNNKSLSNYDSLSELIVKKEERLKSMDSLNTLYVALTRAVKGLIVFSNWDVDTSEVFKTGTYSYLFYNYLKQQSNWDGSKIYQLNSLQDIIIKKTGLIEQQELAFRYSHKKEAAYSLLTHEKLHYDDATYQAKEAGTTWHRFLEFVHTETDLAYAGVKLLEEYPFEEKELYLIKGAEIISHPDLKEYFSEGIKLVNEQRIFTQDGLELRPDRLVFFDQNVVIIDYKTGEEREDHQNQINAYAKALEELNFEISKKLIVYIHKEITIKTVT